MQVWKYDLNPGPQIIEMPRGAEVLHVGVQTVHVDSMIGRGHQDVPRLWALVDPDAPLVRHGVSVHGTGQNIIERGRYVGTFFLTEALAELVFHVFDHGEDPT